MRLHHIALSILPFSASACDPQMMVRQANDSSSPFTYTQGTDGPPDLATLGYFVNHIGLLVSNSTASREWYSKVLGMRHVFTFDNAGLLKITYMAHVQGGRNGTGFQTGPELVRDKNNLAGLVELIEYTVRYCSS
jgi:lactoylglutathione lyase